MTDKPQPPQGWEDEDGGDSQRETIRELKEQGYDPGSLDEKLRSMGHPATASMGTDVREGDVQSTVAGEGPGEPQAPGGDERTMQARDDATGGSNRDRAQAEEESTPD